MKGIIEAFGDEVDCDVFRKITERVNGTKESVIETPEIVTEQPESVPDLVKPVEVEQVPAFDYSEVDHRYGPFPTG